MSLCSLPIQRKCHFSRKHSSLFLDWRCVWTDPRCKGWAGVGVDEGLWAEGSAMQNSHTEQDRLCGTGPADECTLTHPMLLLLLCRI